MQQQIERIKNKLFKLKKADAGCVLFGASKHRYRLGYKMTDTDLKEFESRYGIELPVGYREFILQIGNGGAGPYYGLEAIGDGLFDSLDYKDHKNLINPSQEFPFTEAWNFDFKDLEDDEYDQRQDEYFHVKYASGLLRISNFGCGVSMNLVVNGKEHGNVWVDDRCNDGGIYPDCYFGNTGRIDFLTWYELWLDKSLAECNVEARVEAGQDESEPISWWARLFRRK